jgi:transcriptional regulator with XRE-family HTH domain
MMENAGSLLREAREGANQSIRALAARAGVAASTVSRIEQGTLDPSFTTLSRLLASTGHCLTTQRSPATPGSAPTRLADLARAWIGTAAAGEPDWTALRATLDLLLQHPERIPAAIQDAPRRPASPVQRAILAALAERLAANAALPSPAWARQTKALPDEWAPAGTPRMIQAWRAATLPELRARNLTVDELSLFRAGAPAVHALALA